MTTLEQVDENSKLHRKEVDDMADLHKHPAQPAAEPAQCSWSQDGEDSDMWQTRCGRYFRLDEGDPNDNSMYHCCFCGKPIDCNPYIPEEETP
jgi:hypothetical protein